MPHRFLILLALVVLAGPAATQRYFAHTYGIREGLPSTEIGSIAQDADGRMFFSTRIGLVAYDGFSWEIVSPSEFMGGVVYAHLRQDSRGRLWVVTDTTVFVREGGAWQALPDFAPRKRPLLALPIDLALVEVDGEIRPVVAFESGAVITLQDDRWTPIATAPDDRREKVRALQALGSKILIATEGALRLIDLETAEISDVTGERIGEVLALALDRSRNLVWCVGLDFIGELRFDAAMARPEQVRTLTTAFDLSQSHILSTTVHAAADGRGGLYFGSPIQVLHFAASEGIRRLRRENGLIAEGAADFFLDREQNMWIATARGVTKIITRRLAGYDAEHGLYGDEVSAVAQLPDGRIVFGHNDAGLTLLEGATTRKIKLSGATPNGRVMDLAVGADGTVWAACEYLGLFRVRTDGPSESIGDRQELLPAPDDAALNAVEFDRRGRLWIGTSKGLYRLENDRFVPVPLGADSPFPSVRRVVLGPSGRLFLATIASGLIIVDDERISVHAEPLDLRSVYTALESKSGEIWVGSREGLCVLAEGRLELARDPSVRRPVYGLVEDAKGRLYVGTDNGVYRHDGEQIDHLNSENGLFGLEVNRAATFLDGNGRIWIGTDRGVSVYLPGEERRASPGPTVELLEIEAGSEPHPITGDFELPQGVHDLAFRFRAISFVDEKRVRFRSRLEGFEDGWSEPQLLPLRVIRYPNLTSGRYRLHLQPIDSEGREGPVVESPWVEVPKPYFEETWFKLLLGLMIALLGAGAYGLLAQRRHGRKLEAQVRKRSLELERAADAQARITRLDSLGVLAGGLAHDFNNLLTAIGGNLALVGRDERMTEDSRHMISQAEKACEKAESLTRQLLTFSRGGAPMREVVNMADVVREAVEFSLGGSSLECRFDVSADLPAVFIDVGQFHQVLSNIVINARQATSDTGRLDIRVHAKPAGKKDGPPNVVIEISDDGPGIPADVLPQIFDPYFSTKAEGTGLGLAIAHSIVHKHDGTIEAESKPKAGATFRITIPGTDRKREKNKEATTTPDSISGRVLIMDDQATVRSFARRVLERLGCDVDECMSGEEAVELYSQARQGSRPYAAVLMDMTTPGGMSGLDASRRILEMDANAKIIVSSGYSQDAALADFEAQGFAARLPKPYGPDELTIAIGRILC